MTSLSDKVDALFAAWNKVDSPGCALAVIKGSEIIYKHGYGMADLERNAPISPASVFDIGSTGKQFTAMLIAILAQQGALSLDNSIHQYIPELPIYEQPITIRHLVYHTSGLRDYASLMYLSDMHFENFYYEEELLDLICRQKSLNFKPGDEFLYSNTGYFLLGVLARRITQKPFPELIRENILEQLGMHVTGFNDDAKRIVKNRAIGYSSEEGDRYCTEISFCGGFGDGAIISTVEDLFLWDQNFYNNKLGSGGDELIQQVFTPGVLNSGEKLDYLFGLEIGNYRGLRKVSHAGGWVGYRAELMRFPDQRFSVICLANLNSINPSQLAQQVADIYLADQFTEQDPPFRQGATEFVELPTSQIENLAGFYRHQKNGNFLKLSTQSGKLIGELFGYSFELNAISSTHLKAARSAFDIQISIQEPDPKGVRIISVRLSGRKPELYRKVAAAAVVPSQLIDYLGDYHSGELNISYTILLDKEQLFMKRGYSPKEALQPIKRDVFTSRYLDLQFERNEQNQVCAFKLGAGRVRDICFIK